jgi:hydroxyacylglutathione hydrolase
MQEGGTPPSHRSMPSEARGGGAETSESVHVVTLDAGGDANRAYLLLPAGREEAWCVDPSFGAGAVEEACRIRGRRLAHILLTHCHSDHTAGVEPLRKLFPCRVWCHPSEILRVRGAESIPGEGILEAVPEVEVFFTPGHTPGSVCYRCGNYLFSGDTLFVDWVGRADFQGGDAAALFRSLARIRSLPGHLAVLSGHDYGSVPSRTLAEEIKKNRFLACTDYEEFLRLLPELAE